MNRAKTETHRLPPGQRARGDFPRFGTHLEKPPPPIPTEPTLEVAGPLRTAIRLTQADLAELPRREQVSDFHCVAGWSAVGLRWEGVPFCSFYEEVIAPAIVDGAEITWLAFEGLDGYRSLALREDALADDVLIAERLNGAPLDPDHGAPLRLISPGQYGYVSAKHLCRIRLLTAEPEENYGHVHPLAKWLMLPPLFHRHPRGRVWHEERNGSLPGWALRGFYRAITPPIRLLSRRGSTHPRED